jgi:NADH dehydrogenase FAD-containing subunit
MSGMDFVKTFSSTLTSYNDIGKLTILILEDHLIGTPLAYASKEYAEKAWIRFQDIPALQTSAIKIVHASITQLNCKEKFATIKAIDSKQDIKIPYDYFVAASGVRRTKPSAPVVLTRKEYLEDALEHIRLAEGAKDGVVVIGAGE